MPCRVAIRVLAVIASMVSVAARPLVPRLSAQTLRSAASDPATVLAADAITAADVQRHLDVLTRDSMEQGRLGSAGLRRMVRYVAAQWQAAGFAVDSQAFPTAGRIPVLDSSEVQFTTYVQRDGRLAVTEDGQTMFRSLKVSFADDARFGSDTLLESGNRIIATFPDQAVDRRVPLLVGAHTAAGVRAGHLRGPFVVVVEPPHAGVGTFDSVVRALAQSSNVVAVSQEDSASFARRHADQRVHPPVSISYVAEPTVAPRHWAVYVRADAVAPFFSLAGIDVRRLLERTAPAIDTIPVLGIGLAITSRPSTVDTTTALTVYARVPATDTAWRWRPPYMTISASLDGTSGSGARIGGRPDLTGIATLLALADAFSHPGGQPRRKVTLIATSGVGQGGPGMNRADAAVPLFNLTLDRLDQGAPNTLIADGVDDIDFVTPPDWIAGRHPELALSVVAGATDFDRLSDHTIAIRLTTPSLLLHGGADTATMRTDAELVARRARLVYYLTQDVTSASRWPHWTEGSRLRRHDAPGP